MADSKVRRIIGESSVAVVPMYNFIDNLQDNLLIEILHRLPCQSAIQCKSVSKRWCALISNPYFVHRSIHYHHSRFDNSSQSFTLLIQYTEVGYINSGFLKIVKKLAATSSNPVFKSRRLCLDFIPCFQALQLPLICVVASFNDLLVCCKSTSSQRNYYICNPLTMQWQGLPPLPRFNAVVGFVTEPSYCECDKDNLCIINADYKYKVVCIPQLINSTQFNVHIFCSETGEWSESVVLSPQPINFLITDMISHNGLLYWKIETAIVVFDPFKDIKHCRLINTPVVEVINCLGVCRGSLRICELNQLDHSLSVWDLQDHCAEKWCLEHKICVREILSDNSQLVDALVYDIGHMVHSFRVLAFHPQDGDVVYLKLYSGLVLCNLKRKVFELVNESDLQHSLKVFSWSSVFPLVHPWWPTSIPPLRPNALPY